MAQGVIVESLESRALLHGVVTIAMADVVQDAGQTGGNINLMSHFDNADAEGTVVRFATSVGDAHVALTDDITPGTVANFLGYLSAGGYNDTIIHRTTNVEADGIAVVQGGGYAFPGSMASQGPFTSLANGSLAGPFNLPSFVHIATDAPIANEFQSGVTTNVRGTIAMAKTSNPNGATSEWFFNVSDNAAALDNPANSGGFTTFGRVIGGMDVIDQIAGVTQMLPVLKGFTPLYPFAEMPVRNGYMTFMGAPTNQQAVVVNSVAVAPELTFTAQSDNPAVATAAVNGSTLTYTSVGVGVATITITATSPDGHTVSDAFTVTVTEPDVPPDVQSDVQVGTGAAKSLQFTDVDGTVATLTLKGAGTATVRLVGTTLFVGQSRGRAVSTGERVRVQSITLAGTDGTTRFSVRGRGGDGQIPIPNLDTGGADLRTLDARDAVLTGTMALARVSRVWLAEVGESGSIVAAGLDQLLVARDMAGSLQVTDVSRALSRGTVGGVLVGDWNIAGSAGLVDVGSQAQGSDLTAGGAIGSLRVHSTMAGTLTAPAVASVQAGQITGATLTLTNASAGVTSIARLRAAEVVETTITAAGSISRLHVARSVLGSLFSAGVVDPVNTPDEVSDFVAGSAIRNMRVGGAFADSRLYAPTLVRAYFRTLAGAPDFSRLVVDQIVSLRTRVDGRRLVLSDVTDQAAANASIASQLAGADLGVAVL